jgi:serine/threonine protein kinase
MSNVGSATRSRSSDPSLSNQSLSPNNLGSTRGIDFLGLVNIQSYDRFNQYTIGRSKNCDIVATKRRNETEETKWVHTLISNTHCRIFCLLSNIRHHHATNTFTADGMEVYIEDSSGNGTVINNSILLKKNERRILHTGDTICLVNPKILQKKLRNANLEKEIMQHYSFVFINMYQTQNSCGVLGSMNMTSVIKNIPTSDIKSSVAVKTPNGHADHTSTTYTPTSSGRKRGLVDVKATKTKSIFQQCVTSVENRKNTSKVSETIDTKQREMTDDAARMPPPEKKIKSNPNTVASIPTRTIESEYDLRDEIGSGVCGIVRRAIDRKSGKMVAVKEIAINQGGRNRTVNLNSLNNDLDPAIRAEATMLQSIDHPYIVKLIDVFVHPGKAVYLVMELLNGGDLFDRIVEKGRYTETESRQVMRRIMAAVYYLHQERDIVHRDLKPENILLASRTNDIIVKITDFGLAKSITDDGLKTFCGTPQYFAPEVLRRRHTVAGHGRYGKEADMWSMGVILYILLSGMPPFDASIGTDEIENIKISFTGSRWQGISDSAKDLILKLLSKDPATRISVVNACSHPWILTPDGDTHLHPLEDPNIPRTPVKSIRSNELDKCTEVDTKDGKLIASALHVSPTPPKISHAALIDGNTKQTKLSSWLANK